VPTHWPNEETHILSEWATKNPWAFRGYLRTIPRNAMRREDILELKDQIRCAAVSALMESEPPGSTTKDKLIFQGLEEVKWNVVAISLIMSYWEGSDD
jgi:hypothetical protein